MNEHINKLCFDLSIKYLSRYHVSSFKLSQYLERKLFKIYFKEISKDSTLKEEIKNAISNTISKMITYKYINDDLYAQTKTKEFIVQGKSKNAIYYKLIQQGIEKNTIKTTLEDLHNEDISLYSAVRYIKKKRFGCFAKQPIEFIDHVFTDNCVSYNDNNHTTQAKLMQKQIASMYRNGFPYEIIKKALSLTKDQAENIMNATDAY